MKLVFESAIVEFNILLILLTSLILLGLIIYGIKNFEKLNLLQKVGMLILLFFIFLELSGHLIKVFQSNHIQKIISSSNYKVIEGEIEAFYRMPNEHRLEHFKVKEQYFEILYTGSEPNNQSLYYTFSKYGNGSIRSDGQKVKIYYIVEDGKNKIIKLWIEDN